MSLVVFREPSSTVEAMEQCEAIEAWATGCESVPELRDAGHRLGGIDEYLQRSSTEGRSRVAAAMRRLEVRIGELIGPARPGNPTGANQHGGTSSATEVPEPSLTKDERHEFRRMAEHRGVVEDVIEESTDEQPASRRKVTETIRRIVREKPTEEDVRAAQRSGLLPSKVAEMRQAEESDDLTTKAAERFDDEEPHYAEQIRLDKALHRALTDLVILDPRRCVEVASRDESNAEGLLSGARRLVAWGQAVLDAPENQRLRRVK